MRGESTTGTFALSEKNSIPNNLHDSSISMASADLFKTPSLQLTDPQAQSQSSAESHVPFANRKNTSVTDAGAMAHLLKGCLGTGILAMPNAFKNGGLAFGLVGTLVLGTICAHCMNILVSSSQFLCRRTKTPALDYSNTALVAFETGPKAVQPYSSFAKWFVNAALCTTLYSTGAVYIVFIAQSVKQVGDFHFEEMKIDVRIYMLIFAIPLCLMCLIRNLKYLVPFSMLSNAFILISFAITLSYIFKDLPALSERRNLADPGQIPLFLSTVTFALEGIGVVMPIENSMKNPGHFLGCPGVLNISMGIVVVLYAVMGFFGYLKYGESALGSVTINLPTGEILCQVVKILIAAAVLFTYALQMYVPNKIVWEGLECYVKKGWQNTAQNTYRIGVVIIATCVAAAVPELDAIISLVGAVFLSTLGLLCPAVIETVTFWDELGPGRWKLWKNVIVVVLALVVLVSGAYSSIARIVETYSMQQ
ncbi:proton-coupled amino acid transporter-like protein CG1139 [Anabrus simplex]|uniref:proton-coupled amino acid transporter-like protein CG1139 n=1 Tax=Anabrus simplex TaxID=316456 RepID=UPI0035A27B9D